MRKKILFWPAILIGSLVFFHCKIVNFSSSILTWIPIEVNERFENNSPGAFSGSSNLGQLITTYAPDVVDKNIRQVEVNSLSLRLFQGSTDVTNQSRGYGTLSFHSSTKSGEIASYNKNSDGPIDVTSILEINPTGLDALIKAVKADEPITLFFNGNTTNPTSNYDVLVEISVQVGYLTD